MVNKIHCLMYTSEKNGNVTSTDIESILASARKFNQKSMITGLLLFRSGIFLQFIEGEKSNVRQVLSRIAKDHRHKKIRVLLEFEADDRLFPMWSMGYVDESQFSSTNENLIQDIEWILREPLPEKTQVIVMLRKFADLGEELGSPLD